MPTSQNTIKNPNLLLGLPLQIPSLGNSKTPFLKLTSLSSDFYGPHVTNQIIKQALHPYPDDLVIVTKVGARRGEDKSWVHALSRQELADAVHDNLRNLGLDTLDVVNLRVGGVMGPSEGSIEEPLTVLAELKPQGLIRQLGLSNVSPEQLAEAQTITEIVCVQNVDVFTLGQISNDKAGDGSVPRRQLDGKRPTRGICLRSSPAPSGIVPHFERNAPSKNEMMESIKKRVQQR